LISQVLPLKNNKFIDFLVKSGVISSQMIAGLQDQGFSFGDPSIILEMLYEQSDNTAKFLRIYSEALDNALFSVTDLSLILKLSDISQRSQFSRENIVYLLRISCRHTETLKSCGQVLHCFCVDLMEGQALFYITEGG
jgi:hypothetical protein